MSLISSFLNNLVVTYIFIKPFNLSILNHVIDQLLHCLSNEVVLFTKTWKIYHIYMIYISYIYDIYIIYMIYMIYIWYIWYIYDIYMIYMIYIISYIYDIYIYVNMNFNHHIQWKSNERGIWEKIDKSFTIMLLWKTV